MKYVRRTVYVLLLLAVVNLLPLTWLAPLAYSALLRPVTFRFVLLAVLLFVNIRPLPKTAPAERIQRLAEGTELLWLFSVTAAITLLIQLVWLSLIYQTLSYEGSGFALVVMIANLIIVALPLTILFWNGMLRVYLSSVQLGIKHRILAALCGWIPLLNLWYLHKIIRITSDEVEFETEKYELDAVPATANSR